MLGSLSLLSGTGEAPSHVAHPQAWETPANTDEQDHISSCATFLSFRIQDREEEETRSGGVYL